MNFLEHHRLAITPLAPVHIGCDETYEPTNYVIEGDTLYEFDSHQAFEALEPAERLALLRIVDGRPDDELLKKVQGFFYQRRRSLMSTASHSLPVGAGVVALYHKRVGKTAQQETGGRRIINRLEIERAAYNPLDHTPILPGSSIKGAIRTALLDRENHGKAGHGGERNQDLQQRLFQYSMRELHKDPMRLVQVSDARWAYQQGLPGSEIRFAVNRKKHPVERGGRLVQSQAEQRGLYQLLECVPPFFERAFSLTLNLQHPGQPGVPADRLPVQPLRWDMEDIARACNRFYRPLLEKETELLQRRGYVDPAWTDRVGDLLGLLEDGRTFLLRLGRHSGAEAVTLNGVRSIRIMQGEGQPAKWEAAAKTVWLASPDENAQTGLTPFGWVLVEVDPDVDRALPMRDAQGTYREWARRQAALQGEFEEARERRRQQQREREAQEREAREREREHRRRLEALSPVERELEEFVAGFAGDNPGAELFNRLEAGQWQEPEDRRVVAARIKVLWQEAKKWNPEFAGKNKQKVRQRERCRKVLQYLEQRAP